MVNKWNCSLAGATEMADEVGENLSFTVFRGMVSLSLRSFSSFFGGVSTFSMVESSDEMLKTGFTP